MRFRSAHAHLRNRLACKATTESSPSDYLCQIVPVNALPVEYDDGALKSKDSMIAVHRCHQGNGKPW